MRKALGDLPSEPFGDALEIGAGTGYFTLNLMQAGVIDRATATDISPGMLKTLRANALRLWLKVKTVEAEASSFRSRTEASTSSSDMRSCTTSPTSSAPSRSSTGCCAPAACSSSAASPRATGT